MGKIIMFIVLLTMSSWVNDKTYKKKSNILLLRVSYTTHKFKGGFEKVVLGATDNFDSIPIRVDYKPASDLGSITLFYQPTNELIFDGEIIWAGKGGIKYPKSFNSAGSYSLLNNACDKPDDSRFQPICCSIGNEPINYSGIWDSISKLKVVGTYLKSKKKIGLLLYTPSVGAGDPNQWDWFVIMYK